MTAPMFGKLFGDGVCGNPARALAQTSWSTRVPCPGGKGAGAGGCAVLASLESLSAAGGVCGVLVSR